MKATSCILLLCCCAVSIVFAVEVIVRFENNTYFLTAKFDVEASPAQVMQALTDYDNLADLNPAIIVSELLQSPDKSNERIRTVVHGCILFFCKNVTRVEDVQQMGNEKLEATIIPMLSDLRSGYAIWLLAKNPFGTTVKYEADAQPKFWVPPIIRSYVLKRKFKKQATETVKRLQEVAKIK